MSEMNSQSVKVNYLICKSLVTKCKDLITTHESIVTCLLSV